MSTTSSGVPAGGQSPDPAGGQSTGDDQVFQGESVPGRAPSGRAPSGRAPSGRAPSRQNPLRFGIGAIMVAVTVLAVQFSLVNYLGPWAAMVFPPLICASLVLIVLGVELWSWRQSDANAQRMGRTTFSWLTAYIFILGVSAMAVGGGKIGFDLVRQWRLERQLQRDLGFTHVTGYIWGQKMPTRRTVYFVMIQPGGPLERAGVMGGEAVITELPPADWLRMMHENRGQSVQITLAQGAPAKSLEDCTQRVVSVNLPK